MPPKPSKRDRLKDFLGRLGNEIVRSRSTTPEPSGAKAHDADTFAEASLASVTMSSSTSQTQSYSRTSGLDDPSPGVLIIPVIGEERTEQAATGTAQTPEVGLPNSEGPWSPNDQSLRPLNTSRVPFHGSLDLSRHEDTSTGAAATHSRQPLQLQSHADPLANSALSHTFKASGVAHTKATRSVTFALRKLGRATTAMPPLSSVVELLADCMELVSVTEEGHQDFEALVDSISTKVETLEKHLRVPGPTEITESVSNIVDKLKDQADYLIAKQGREGMKLVDVERDLDDLMRCYRRVDALFQQLLSDAVLDIWRITHDTRDITTKTLGVANEGLGKANRVLDEHEAASSRSQTTNTRLERMRSVKEARYDSGTEVHRNGCTPGTRASVLRDILDWVNDVDGSRIYWMNGMAGTGKTAIAYSLCEVLKGTSQLGASFFCSRLLPGCRDATRIVPTLAYQLARSFRSFQVEICQVLGADPDICGTGVASQFKSLIYAPLLQMEQRVDANRLVIAIDALDECSDRYSAQLILDTLFRYAADLPVKFFVTCRPEYGLLDRVASERRALRSIFHLHDIEQSLVGDDILAYLRAELESSDINEHQIQELAERSGKLFIYAATVVQYLKPKASPVNFQKRLSMILETKNASNRTYEPLDLLYATILSAALENTELESWEVDSIRLILRTILCVQEPMRAESLALLLGLQDVTEARLAVEPLRSVLYESENDGLVSTLHASFPDFMDNPLRSGHFWFDSAEHHHLLARQCFETMRDLLRFNICDLESSFVLDQDAPSIERRIEQAIPSHLFYACSHWNNHLALAGGTNGDLVPYLDEFFRRRVLFWMQVMNLKKSAKSGVTALVKTYSWMKNTKIPDDLCAICQDAQRFMVVVGANPVRKSTPHIYVSVLALWDRSKPMWSHYGSRMRSPVQAKGTAIDNRESAALSVWQAKSEVFFVSVSPDGNRVASAHADGTICVWDTHTGDVVTGPLEGHTDHVNSVAFSPDSTCFASGSGDKSVRIWDAKTGHLVTSPCEGHTGMVRSVVYSPNGRYIASGSDDCTIRIWDATTGQPVGKPYVGRTVGIWSIAYSPDGRRLVSGAGDCTIRIWDAQTGNQLINPLIGHTDEVRSVTFSRDGSRIASGSQDHTVRIWDSQSGQLIAGPFQEHADIVQSVAYSPDGNHIVSGSKDHTIRIWDAHTGHTLAGPLRGHTFWVNAAVFMPDGDRIVSCSPDQTIRIWDARTRHTRSSLSEGHTAGVGSVAFSPDSSQIVSGSEDCTVCIWDAQTGSRMAGPFKGHTDCVRSVAFSPSGDRVASASDDHTIRMWDARTGAMHGGPFEGHTDMVFSIAFSPDGSHIASGSRDFTIRVWDSQTGKMAAGPFRGHSDSVFSVAYSPDGDRIVSGSGDRTVRIWDARTGMGLTPNLEGHTEAVYSVAYSPDGKHIVSGSFDCTIRIWDVQAGATLRGTLIGHTGRVHPVAYSPDGRCIVSGSTDHTIRIWDVETRQPLAGPLQAHTSWINSVALSPNGRFITSGSLDHAIRVWDLQECLATTPNNPAYWTLNEDGWVVGHDSSLLFWVPPDLRPCLKWPQNIAMIHHQGSFELDFTHALIGPRWAECYTSE